MPVLRGDVIFLCLSCTHLLLVIRLHFAQLCRLQASVINSIFESLFILVPKRLIENFNSQFYQFSPFSVIVELISLANE